MKASPAGQRQSPALKTTTRNLFCNKWKQSNKIWYRLRVNRRKQPLNRSRSGRHKGDLYILSVLQCCTVSDMFSTVFLQEHCVHFRFRFVNSICEKDMTTRYVCMPCLGDSPLETPSSFSSHADDDRVSLHRARKRRRGSTSPRDR